MKQEMIYTLAYVSSAVAYFTKEELLDLLAKSRRKNEAAGLTGMLLYKGGNFMQVLEGPEPVVKQAFERISTDPRHHRILVLYKGEAKDRQFSDWSMGFANLDEEEAKLVAGYTDYLKLPLTDERFVKDPTHGQKLLRLFKENMR